MTTAYDVVVIGAGPSGAVASAMLVRKGLRVLVLEKQQFPRFVIGESLLPAAMQYLEAAGLAEAVHAYGFQRKYGALFTWGERQVAYDFHDNSTGKNGEIYEVKRANFDKVLIDAAAQQGVEVRFGQTVTAFHDAAEGATLEVRDDAQTQYSVQAKFVIDASGYGRVLAKLLNLDTPSDLAPRLAYTTHIADNITAPDYDRDMVTIATLPTDREKWMWLIPFSDGRASIGVVSKKGHFDETLDSREQIIQHAQAVPYLARVLQAADWDVGMPVREYRAFSVNVKRFFGKHFVLLGNAGEFIDPVFSSGVMIAVYSANLAATLLAKQFAGEKVDWQTQYADELKYGVDAFKAYVEGWYDTRFQDIIYCTHDSPTIRRYIASILAGYAWDRDNPFVAAPERRMNMVTEAVRAYGFTQ